MDKEKLKEYFKPSNYFLGWNAKKVYSNEKYKIDYEFYNLPYIAKRRKKFLTLVELCDLGVSKYLPNLITGSSLIYGFQSGDWGTAALFAGLGEGSRNLFTIINNELRRTSTPKKTQDDSFKELKQDYENKDWAEFTNKKDKLSGYEGWLPPEDRYDP